MAEAAGVAFIVIRGGVTGNGGAVAEDKAGTAGEIVREARIRANAIGVKLSSIILEPGITSNSAVQSALDFLRTSANGATKLIVYGYSRGGDAVVDLAQTLQERGRKIELLLTVDAAYGPASVSYVSPVDRVIPSNVDVNLNYYQTEPSGPSAFTRSGRGGSEIAGTKGKVGGSSRDGGSSDSDSGSFDLVGSRGAPNSASKPASTRVHNLRIVGAEHGEIDERTKSAVLLQVFMFLRSTSTGSAWSPLSAEATGLL